LVFGVTPGARGGMALASLFWQGKSPASLIVMASVGTIDEALGRIIGTTGEWGELNAVAIAAPLTWAGTPKGTRPVDIELRKKLPKWAPRTWVRPPLALPSPIVVQGIALTWALASEIRHEQLPKHAVVECHPRLILTRLWPDAKEAILGYAGKGPAIEHWVERLVAAFTDSGLVRIESEPPKTPVELEAMVAAVTALAIAVPDAGLVVHELAGGDVRPVGKRPVALLEALP
jgi:hypothetical protein